MVQMTYFQGRNRDADIESRQVDTEGNGREGQTGRLGMTSAHCTVEDRQLAGKPLRGRKLCSVPCDGLGGWDGRVGWRGMCIHITVQQQPMQCCNYIPKRKSNAREKKKNFMRTFSAAKTKKVIYLQGYFFPSFKILMSLTCY